MKNCCFTNLFFSTIIVFVCGTFGIPLSCLAAEPFFIESGLSVPYHPLVYRGDDIWYDSTYRTGPDWTRVGKDWQHPGQKNDSVRVFSVSRDGVVKISGNVRKLHLQGDGIVATISLERNGGETNLWSIELAGDDGIGVDPKLTLDVKRGDKIRFIINRRNEISCDTTGWNPVVTYPAGGKRFEAADAFADQENAHWSYQMNGPDPNAPKPKAVVTLTDTDYAALTAGIALVPDFEMFPLVLTDWLQEDDYNLDGKSPEEYIKTRLVKRSELLSDPRLQFGELLFVKSRPPAYSHLVGQYFGWNQRPGGGLFVLERPGVSLKHRDILQGQLPPGHVLEPRLSYNAKRIAFSYVDVPDERIDWQTLQVNAPENKDYYYHLYEIDSDGTALRQLTNDCYDDMMPDYLPDGGLVFVSGRRRAYSRCFGSQFGKRWHSYTLFRIDTNESGQFDQNRIKQLSFNDVSEWFPAVTHSGTILFARWDYIDRDAVTHQNLWSMRPDGTNPVAVWGNATPNPHCSFQAKPIPGSNKLVFIASAHHSITAGPLCIVDPAVDINSLDAVTRITPGAFPESESWDIPEYYNSPWALGEDLFLVAYSREKLLFEPMPNRDNALGLYVMDNKGNRELLYRDETIGSTCPIPLAPRPVPPIVAFPDLLEGEMGEVVITDVTRGLGDVKPEELRQIRVVQIFPKTTVVGDSPKIGVAGEENTRAILGVAPIEPDGSARFMIPPGIPIYFQVLDKDGFAYQTMRSTTSVMPGEKIACAGCHEDQMEAAFSAGKQPMAFRRPASILEPTPESGRPYGFAEMIQPIINAKCIECHNRRQSEGGIDLEGRLDEQGFSKSYNSLCFHEPELIPRFAARNQIQVTPPGGVIGARGSRLIHLLKQGHADVELTPEELERFGTWIDMNAVFYGTFDSDEIHQQRAGKPISMPKIQ